MNHINFNTVNIGFGSMADEYDAIRETNIPVKIMREKFYETVSGIIKPPARMLELNCGSGIDASYFAEKGYNIIATDISDKMLHNANSKNKYPNLSFRKMNFLDAGSFEKDSFDVIVSNLGGLNCYNDLSPVTNSLKKILKPGGHFIAAVMPQFSLWEFFLLFKGEFNRAFRRMKKNGIYASVGNEKVFVKYFSPPAFFKFFKNDFKMIKTRGLKIFAPPPPAENWYKKHPLITSLLDKTDNTIENFYLSSFAGDFYIIVLQKK